MSTQVTGARLSFWAAMLSGGYGSTYGANGLWQLNTRERPYGPSPHGATWGEIPWDEAYRLPGSAQLGLAKELLSRYKWWCFEPHPEWVEPAGSPENVDLPFAAGIPGEVRVIYFFAPTFAPPVPQYQVRKLEAQVHYRAYFWDSRSGREHDLGAVAPDGNGNWTIPVQPVLKDWVVVLERQDKEWPWGGGWGNRGMEQAG